MKIILEDTCTFRPADGGLAEIAEIIGNRRNGEGLFVRLHSWDADKEHCDVKALNGKRVRVTIETLE